MTDSSAAMQYAVLQPLPNVLGAPQMLEAKPPATIVSEWLGGVSADRYISGKALRLDAYVDPKEKAARLARKKPPKRFKLSKTELKNRGLLDISQDNLKYQDGLILNDLWRQYILQILPTSNRPPTPAFVLSQCNALAISDFHGAHIRVIQAKNPSTIGIEGIVMQETEQTFRLISADDRIRTILKSDCIFHLFLNDHVFILHGQHLCYRTDIRSKLKLKPKDSVKL